jgi:hypothetical protein
MCLGQDRRDAAPQTPLRKVRLVRSGARFALAPQWESICGWGFSILRGARIKTEAIANENP